MAQIRTLSAIQTPAGIQQIRLHPNLAEIVDIGSISALNLLPTPTQTSPTLAARLIFLFLAWVALGLSRNEPPATSAHLGQPSFLRAFVVSFTPPFIRNRGNFVLGLEFGSAVTKFWESVFPSHLNCSALNHADCWFEYLRHLLTKTSTLIDFIKVQGAPLSLRGSISTDLPRRVASQTHKVVNGTTGTICGSYGSRLTFHECRCKPPIHKTTYPGPCTPKLSSNWISFKSFILVNSLRPIHIHTPELNYCDVDLGYIKVGIGMVGVLQTCSISFTLAWNAEVTAKGPKCYHSNVESCRIQTGIGIVGVSQTGSTWLTSEGLYPVVLSTMFLPLTFLAVGFDLVLSRPPTPPLDPDLKLRTLAAFKPNHDSVPRYIHFDPEVKLALCQTR
ncbi:hypothetical protein C8R47DRAFT_1206309 [Mycena vitilis]|nr:hypothetical protein C8R47DRAFT_1206309 [Mycena vitilis]